MVRYKCGTTEKQSFQMIDSNIGHKKSVQAIMVLPRRQSLCIIADFGLVVVPYLHQEATDRK